VVEAKGAVQCKGRNRKKNTQCRNAALMEYIGPRPQFCAEHIELDPKSMYEKCKSSYQKEPGDNKGCKEVVLKEFGFCYKHFPDLLNDLLRRRDVPRIREIHVRISELLTQLEREASAAKKKDGDLYQRKNKLIPKFQEMKKLACKAVEVMEMELQSGGAGGNSFLPTRSAPISIPYGYPVIIDPLSSPMDALLGSDDSCSDDPEDPTLSPSSSTPVSADEFNSSSSDEGLGSAYIHQDQCLVDDDLSPLDLAGDLAPAYV
jgi:hypothetical protein